MMRKLLWKKAAITAMAGTILMMTGCAKDGSTNAKPETLSAASEAEPSTQQESSSVSQTTSVTPNTTVQAATSESQKPTATESAAPESTVESKAPASSSAANSSTSNSVTSSAAQESSPSFEWISGEVPEGDGNVSWFTVDVITEDNFWVTFHGAENDEEISNVKIAVWTEANGQDDIEYIDAESIGNETKSCPVYISNHNNEKSGYILKVSYTNKAGEEKTSQYSTQVSVE